MNAQFHVAQAARRLGEGEDPLAWWRGELGANFPRARGQLPLARRRSGTTSSGPRVEQAGFRLPEIPFFPEGCAIGFDEHGSAIFLGQLLKTEDDYVNVIQARLVQVEAESGEMPAAVIARMKPNPLIDALAEGTDEGESGEDSELDPSDGDTAEGDTALPDLAGDEPLTCAPLDEFDAECGACLGASCCELMLECAAVEDCSCLADCLLAGGNNGSCKNSCGGTQPGGVAELEVLLACADDVCSSAC